jgi:hypothetical protein
MWKLLNVEWGAEQCVFWSIVVDRPKVDTQNPEGVVTFLLNATAPAMRNS